MRRASNYLIPLVAAATAWGVEAHAQGVPSPTEVTDQQLADQAEAETVEIFDERPDKPFDRDTEVRLTGEQLAARGAVDLGSALALLPDVSVRDAGRGGLNIDIRGARKGAVSILIDGVLVTDPYYGTFDVSTIPITDIVQIRVSTAPQSPIDGPGGPGGVIEVHTRDAIGPQIVIARATGDSLPSFGATATARAALANHLALRISGSGLAGARDLELPSNAAIGEHRHAATGAARLEYRDHDDRLVVDGFVDDRHYISPPSDTVRSTILMIDRETTERMSAKADVKVDKLQLQSEAWVHHLARRSRYFTDPALAAEIQLEDLSALRTGGMALATQPIGRDARWAASASVDRESVEVRNIGNEITRGDLAVVELAADGQYEKQTVRVDAAGGVAFPFGVGANPWPEAKLVAKWRPRFGHTELTATAARKGRVPSLRERFDLATGNPKLGPEQATHLEMRAIEHVDDHVHVEVAPFYRHTTGTIRVSVDPADLGKLINLGKLDLYGIDLVGRWQAHRVVELGAAYDYIKASSDTAGTDPLDRLPHHRAEASVRVTPAAGVSMIARVKYFGDSIDKTMPVGSYTLVEATATAQFTKEYLGVLRVDDLFDVRPETRAGYHTAGRVVSLMVQGSWE